MKFFDPVRVIENKNLLTWIFQVRRNSSIISANPEANKHRLAAIERANRGDFDEKAAEQMESV